MRVVTEQSSWEDHFGGIYDVFDQYLKTSYHITFRNIENAWKFMIPYMEAEWITTHCRL